MPVTMQDVVRSLMPDEADLQQAATALGTEALPHLALLVRGPDPMIASKATYVAGLMRDARSLQVLQVAAAREDRMVQIAAATAVRSLEPDQAVAILKTLLFNSDPECRQLAIEGVPLELIHEVQDELEMLALTDPYPFIRDLSAGILTRSPKGHSDEDGTTRSD